jgi:nucleoside-diphosphate-sugar epimerase
MKNILITGASGFIGSAFVDEALSRGWNVWAGVRQTSNKQFLNDSRIHFIDIIYEKPDLLKKQLENHFDNFGCWDYVIHCAGLTKANNLSDFDKVNYEYTVNLVEALKSSENVPEKFIYISSLGVMGPGKDDTSFVFDLSYKPEPNTAYGISKLKAENFLKSVDDFPYIIMRPSGVYGPRDRDYLEMVKLMKRGIDVSLGFNTQILDFLYIDDFTKAVYLAMESSIYNRIWFVSEGKHYYSYEFSNILRSLLHKKYVFKITVPVCLAYFVSLISGVVSSLSGKNVLINPDKYKILKQRNWTCDISDIERDLGFKADYNLHNGFVKTIEWYKKNGWL